MTPKVSILIPVFNRRQFIAECIQSALDQTFTDFEVVIVDNASDDGTWEICQRFATQYARVRVFRNETNIGPVRNWLRCIEEAKGQYGKLLFSDDLMMPEFLAETLPYLEDPTVAFVSTAALIGEALGNGVACYALPGGRERLSTKEYFENLASRRYPVPLSPGAAIFRMADLRANLLLHIPVAHPHDFTKNGAGPDVLLFALTALRYQSVVMLQKPLVFFRRHADSFTRANTGNAVTEGYRLALAWFFRKYLSKQHWASWLARIWLSEIWRRRAIKYPGMYATRYEGNSGLRDVSLIVLMSVRILIKRWLDAVIKIGLPQSS